MGGEAIRATRCERRPRCLPPARRGRRRRSGAAAERDREARDVGRWRDGHRGERAPARIDVGRDDGLHAHRRMGETRRRHRARRVESLLERAGSRELPRLAALLANHVARVRACQALAEEGVRPRDAAGKLKCIRSPPKRRSRTRRTTRRRARATRSCAWPSSTSRSRANSRLSRRARARARARRGDAGARSRRKSVERDDEPRRPATSAAPPCSCGAHREPQRGRATRRAACAPRPRGSRPLGDRGLEAPPERLRRGLEAEVLEPLLGGGPDALLLLLDVRHSVETPAPAGPRMVATAPLLMLTA